MEHVKELQALRAKIVEWARARNIIQGATTHAQFLKLVEEYRELHEGLSHSMPEIIEDGIGDVFVVYTILAEQLDVSEKFAEIVTDAILEPVINEYDTLHILGELAHALARQDALAALAAMHYGVQALNQYALEAVYERTTLASCVSRAYEEIKDRKGIMFGGVFVKESDPRYPDMLKRYNDTQAILDMETTR